MYVLCPRGRIKNEVKCRLKTLLLDTYQLKSLLNLLVEQGFGCLWCSLLALVT